MKYIHSKHLNIVLYFFIFVSSASCSGLGEDVIQKEKDKYLQDGHKSIHDLTYIEDIITSKVMIGFESISQPLNKIVLIRSSTETCAIKFTSFRRGHDKKKATYFTSGSESLYAKYDIYHDLNKKWTSDNNNDSIEHRKLNSGPIVGLGHIGFELGDNIIKCGNINVNWLYPTTITLNDKKKFEISPTGWSKYEEIDLNDPRLKWFRYDETRLESILPMLMWE